MRFSNKRLVVVYNPYGRSYYICCARLCCLREKPLTFTNSPMYDVHVLNTTKFQVFSCSAKFVYPFSIPHARKEGAHLLPPRNLSFFQRMYFKPIRRQSRMQSVRQVYETAQIPLFCPTECRRGADTLSRTRR